MDKLKLLDLFSGIGGFSLGLERTGGFETVAFCEIEPFPRKILNKHWPEVPCYEDVRELTGSKLAADGIAIDAISAGFPCQDISTAGKQAGLDGERSGLWSEVARLIRELQPRIVFLENVSALLSNGLGRVLGELAECGYDAEWQSIPAWAVGKPHNRSRVWIMAYPESQRRAGVLPHLIRQHSEAGHWRNQKAAALAASRDLNERAKGHVCGQSPFLDGAYGLSEIVGGLAAGGNAVVPAIPELLGNAYLESIGWGRA